MHAAYTLAAGAGRLDFFRELAATRSHGSAWSSQETELAVMLAEQLHEPRTVEELAALMPEFTLSEELLNSLVETGTLCRIEVERHIEVTRVQNAH